MLRITADPLDLGRTQHLDLSHGPGSRRPEEVCSLCAALAVCLALVALVLSVLSPHHCFLSQGLQDECQYLLQPQLIVRRLLDVAVLVPGRPSEQTLSLHNRSALYK